MGQQQTVIKSLGGYIGAVPGISGATINGDGTMRDTLTHLVSGTISRRDSNKFIYILNQMDIAAREDNPEEVVGAWQRALAQHGLTAGKFFRVYSPTAAMETSPGRG